MGAPNTLARHDATIAFHGAVANARSHGRAEIELANGHRIIAVAASRGDRVEAGDRVRVVLPIGQLTGWQFHSRPQLSAEIS